MPRGGVRRPQPRGDVAHADAGERPDPRQLAGAHCLLAGLEFLFSGFVVGTWNRSFPAGSIRTSTTSAAALPPAGTACGSRACTRQNRNSVGTASDGASGRGSAFAAATHFDWADGTDSARISIRVPQSETPRTSRTVLGPAALTVTRSPGSNRAAPSVAGTLLDGPVREADGRRGGALVSKSASESPRLSMLRDLSARQAPESVRTRHRPSLASHRTMEASLSLRSARLVRPCSFTRWAGANAVASVQASAPPPPPSTPPPERSPTPPAPEPKSADME
eukprot:scaffold18992_cov113-Isochrysis_galbana.AAC.2